MKNEDYISLAEKAKSARMKLEDYVVMIIKQINSGEIKIPN
jgi:hypothetical protein